MQTATLDPASDGLRDRFLAFAFAAADLLVEASVDGRIRFAAGAFIARFGVDAGSFLSRHVSELIAAVDQPAFAMALAAVERRGRVPPLLVRLADAGQTPVSVAALLMPGPPARLCLTFGATPASGSDRGAALSAMAEGTAPLVHAARLAGTSGEIGLIELPGWADLQRGLSGDDQLRLADRIGEALLGSATLASDVGGGRFGVVCAGECDVPGLVARLERALGGGSAVRVNGAQLTLAADALEPAHAARALRYALTCFAERGAAAAVSLGAGEGLAGIMAHAQARARSLRVAIAERRFALRYQPVVGLVDRKIRHFEALIRPNTMPGAPQQSPQEFVCFAETVGLCEELDTAVLREAVAALRDSPEVCIAVNVSGLSMQSRTFGARLMQQVGAPELHGRLMVELTETAEIADMESAAASMAALRASGIRLCLDDFGAGAAAFRYLRDFPVDIVKIDGSYVTRAGRSPRERGFVASMVDLAGSVKADTVAEMVETEAQAALMVDLGVNLGQGWLFGRPGALPGAGRARRGSISLS